MYTSSEKSIVTSCFPLSKPKFLPRSNKRDSVDYTLSHFHPFDDYYDISQEVNGNGSDEDNLMKSKTKTSKIFKKVKHLITSLFTSRIVDKSKEEEKSLSTTNVSGSCLDSIVTDSEEKVDDYGAIIVVDENSPSCVKESSYNEEVEFDMLEIQPQSYQISESLKMEIIKNNIDQDADVFHKWWKFQEKDCDFPEEEKNNVGFGKEEYCSRVSSSELFEIDLSGVLFCGENNGKDDKSLTLRYVDDSEELPPWVPHGLKNVIVELEREKGVPEPMIVVSKRMFPFEVDGHNRFKIPRLCFGY